MLQTVGLAPVLAHMDSLECSHDKGEWSSQTPCFPLVTEP